MRLVVLVVGAALSVADVRATQPGPVAGTAEVQPNWALEDFLPLPEEQPPEFVPAGGFLLAVCAVAAIGGLGYLGYKAYNRCKKLAPALTNRFGDNLNLVGNAQSPDSSEFAANIPGSCYCGEGGAGLALAAVEGGDINGPSGFATDPDTGKPYSQLDIVVITELDPDGGGLTNRILYVGPSQMVSTTTSQSQMRELGIADPPRDGAFVVNGRRVLPSEAPVMFVGHDIWAIRGPYANADMYVEQVIETSSDLLHWEAGPKFVMPVGTRTETSLPPASTGDMMFIRVRSREVQLLQ